jgi:hypothetical protein
MPDSRTDIAGKYPDHEALGSICHNVACQLVHAAIRKAAKGGGALHSVPDLVERNKEMTSGPQWVYNPIPKSYTWG